MFAVDGTLDNDFFSPNHFIGSGAEKEKEG